MDGRNSPYSSNTYPYVQGGNLGLPRPSRARQCSGVPYGIVDANWGVVGSMVGTNNGLSSTGSYLQAYNLMNYMAGSVGVDSC